MSAAAAVLTTAAFIAVVGILFTVTTARPPDVGVKMKLAGTCYFGGMALMAYGLWDISPALSIGSLLFINGAGAIEGDHLERVSRRMDEWFIEIRDVIGRK